MNQGTWFIHVTLLCSSSTYEWNVYIGGKSTILLQRAKWMVQKWEEVSDTSCVII
jgi:hypothetical protein